MNLSMREAIKRGLRPGVMLTTLLIFGTLIAIGTVNGDSFITMLNAVFSSLMVNGGWLISLGTLGFIVFLLIIIFHPIGNVKLGGKDAKPEYSLWNWFAISLCAGIGTGIVFWGPVEPLKFAVQPQASTGIVGGTRDAVIWALSKSYLHWSFAPYEPQFKIGYCSIQKSMMRELFRPYMADENFAYERRPIQKDEENDIAENPYHGNLLLKKDASKALKKNIQCGLATLAAGSLKKREE